MMTIEMRRKLKNMYDFPKTYELSIQDEYGRERQWIVKFQNFISAIEFPISIRDTYVAMHSYDLETWNLIIVSGTDIPISIEFKLPESVLRYPAKIKGESYEIKIERVD